MYSDLQKLFFFFFNFLCWITNHYDAWKKLEVWTAMDSNLRTLGLQVIAVSTSSLQDHINWYQLIL